MKRVFLTLMLCLITRVSHAGILNVEYPGHLWARFNYQTSPSNIDSQSKNGLLMMDFEQGFQFADFPHAIGYVGVTIYNPFDDTDENHLSIGVKNNTFLAPFVFGIERQQQRDPRLYVTQERYVVYISIYQEWTYRR
jgi:hypothetical protein